MITRPLPLKHLALVLCLGLAAQRAPGAPPQPGPLVVVPDPPRAHPWAQKLDRPGLPNLHRLNDHLYRGAQPTPEGYRELERLGIKTVVCLRASKPAAIPASGLAVEWIPFRTWFPDRADARRFLEITADTNRWPVFVHCLHGADRTGTMIALHRVMAEGWTRDEAAAEMVRGGFGFHPVWMNLVRHVRHADLGPLRRAPAGPSPAGL